MSKPGQNRSNTIVDAAKPKFTALHFTNPSVYEHQQMLGGYVDDKSGTTADNIPRLTAVIQRVFLEFRNGNNQWDQWTAASFNNFRAVVSRNRNYKLTDFATYLAEAAATRAFYNSLRNVVYGYEYDSSIIGNTYYGSNDYEALKLARDQMYLTVKERYPLPRKLADWVDRYFSIGKDSNGFFYDGMLWIPVLTGFSKGTQAFSEGAGVGQVTLGDLVSALIVQTNDDFNQIATDIKDKTKYKDPEKDAPIVDIKDSILRNMNTVSGCTGQTAAHSPLTFAYSAGKDLANLVAGEGSNDWNYYVKEKTSSVNNLDVFYHALIDYASQPSGDANEYYAVVGTWQYQLITVDSAGGSGIAIRQIIDVSSTDQTGILIAAIVQGNNDIFGGFNLQIAANKILVAPCLPAFVEVIGSNATTWKDVWANSVIELTSIEYTVAE